MPKNVILYGSSGTGKTILLVECVKMKVAKYHNIGMPLKIIFAIYHPFAKKLHYEFLAKYDLNDLKNVVCKTMDELFKGEFIILSSIGQSPISR